MTVYWIDIFENIIFRIDPNYFQYNYQQQNGIYLHCSDFSLINAIISQLESINLDKIYLKICLILFLITFHDIVLLIFRSLIDYQRVEIKDDT
jgi:hypothetical protein